MKGTAMLGGAHTDLLFTVTLLFLSHTGIQCRAENDFSLVPLPEWRPNSDYVTRCFYGQQKNLVCDWTRSQQRRVDVVVNILESGTLGLEEEACLEFWYHVQVAVNGSELRALLKSSAGLREIWTSPALPGNSWRQVFVPLKIVKPETQVVLEATSTGEQITFNRIGVRRGLCGPQCESNTELWTDESTRCICSGGQLSCFPSQCPEGQICGPQRRGSTGISTTGMCTIHSHTDCSTFDGVLFRFLAPCTFILAKTCSSAKGLPMFSVEVVNEQDGNSSVPAIQQVTVNTENFRVSLLIRQTQRVVVNGFWRKLPLSLNNGTVNIQSNPAAVVLVTSFGLSVLYDSAGSLQIILPPSYSNAVCGLCGNFNHFKSDDLHKSDGTTAQNATALVQSWQTGQSTSSCETILAPYQCDPVEEAEYTSEFYCGGLISKSGPFADCQSVLGAESYFRACVVGMCSTHGDPAVLCETLQVYTNICKEAGVAVPIWRNSTFCPLQCAENSHYNSCADGCPEVCSSLDLTSSCGNCEERCVCDNGFKLSGGKCVPAKDCGCWYNGNHYEKGSTFVAGQCKQGCHCMGNNDLRCTSMQCADSEVCKVRDGVKDCFPFMPTTCSVYGDPHYITFDKMAYDFQGGCSYTLTTTCGGESPVQFTVIGHNMHPPRQNFSLSKLEAVTLEVEDLHLTLNQSGEVYVNDHSVQLPYSTNEPYGSIWVYMRHNYIILETSFGLRMMIDRQKRLFLQVDESYKYELCGLCGTFSGYQDDDFVTPDGQKVTEPFEFGDSWRVRNNDECTVFPNDPRRCDYDEENEAYTECSTLLGDAFQLCHETIHPSNYLSSCVYDYCATNGDQQTSCESLKSYAAACQVAGVELPPWQTDTACASPPTTSTVPTTPTSPTPDQTLCPINCDFEKNLCGWKQLIQDSFDWTRHSGPTPSNLTGPNEDHTTGAGFYMYIEGNSVTQGELARLLSSKCHYSGPLCVHFWYHMYGSATTMAINIYLLKDNRATKVWSMINNQGPKWHPGNINISVSGPFQIIVEGIRGSDAQSDVAIDDVSIDFGSCSVTFPGQVVGTVLPYTTAEVLPAVCYFGCSFDNDLCSWNQMITDAFDWTWQSGSTPTQMTGPSADHTGGGHYLYIEASSVTHGDTARLISSECFNTGPQCLQFWYHMYGSADTMGLHVYLLQNRISEVIWWKRNNQGNMWHLAQVELTESGAFQIYFEGRRGSNDQSDVAIDDISVHHGHCGDLTEPTTPAPELPPANSSTTTARTKPPTSNHPETSTAETQFPTSTTRPKPPATTLPQTSYTATSESQATSTPQSPITGRPQPPTTPTTVTQKPPTSTQPQSPSIAPPESQSTNIPQSSTTTAKPQPSTTARPKPTTMQPPSSNTVPSELPTTSMPQPPTATTGPQPPTTTFRPQPITTTARPILQTTTLPHTSPTAPSDSQTTSIPKPSTTTFQPQTPTTDIPQPSTTKARPLLSTTTARPKPPTTVTQKPLTTQSQTPSIAPPESQSTTITQSSTTTAKPQPPTTDRTQPPTTTNRPQPPTTTAGPQPPTTTAGPQPPTTTAGPQPPTTTAGPQPPTTTAGPQPPTTTAGPQPPTTTAGPQPSTTTAGPQPSTTTFRPHPTTTATRPQTPTTTTRPQTPTTTTRPQTPTTTTRPQTPTTTTWPQTPTTTTRPQPPTTTTRPQPPTTTTRPQPPTTTTRPQPPTTTTRPQPPTTTAGPQLPSTTGGPHPTTTATRPQPPTTTVKPHPPTTARPKPTTVQPPTSSTASSSTSMPQPPTTTAGLHPPTTATSPQIPTTTTRPQPPTTTAGPQPPTTTFRPHPTTTTTRPQPPTTTAGPQPPSTTLGPHSTTTATRPQPPTTTAKPHPPTTARPKPTTVQPPTSSTASSSTSMPQPPTTTAGPQPPTTTFRPHPTTTAVPTPSCPVNSHYTTCMPACRPTCSNLNGSPHCNNSDNCVPGCVCNEGFVWKWWRCVPLEECGCVDRDGNKYQFNEIWYTDHCSQKCECEKDDGRGKIDCDDDEECGENAVCLQNDKGEYYCKSTDFSECTIEPDPKYKTFDKMKHDFKGKHSYILVRTNNLPINRPDVYIVSINTNKVDDDDDDDDTSHDGSSSEENHSHRNREEDNDDDSEEDEGRYRLKELKIIVYNHTVELKKNRKLVVDGKRTKMPVSPTAGLHIREHSSHIYLKTDFGLSVEFDGRSTAEIKLPHTYRSKVGGLCGNFDGQTWNDRMKPDGTRAKTVQEFGDSWRV